MHVTTAPCQDCYKRVDARVVYGLENDTRAHYLCQGCKDTLIVSGLEGCLNLMTVVRIGHVILSGLTRHILLY